LSWSYADVAKTIDRSLLRPVLTVDEHEDEAGRRLGVVRP
jgi:hypothetical protein